MTINLINVAKYELNDEKSSSIPLSVFRKLTGYSGETDNGEKCPKGRLFKTQADFLDLSVEEMSEFDESKDVRILNNGQFIVFLKEKETKTKGE